MINAQQPVLLGFMQRQISNLRTVVKKIILFRNQSCNKELVGFINKWSGLYSYQKQGAAEVVEIYL